MKLAKKTLSVFLSLLMIFSACSVGLFGITASATEVAPVASTTSSAYTATEVKDIIAKAASSYVAASASNTGGSFVYTTNDYNMLLAVDAVVSYAMKTYHSAYDSKNTVNHGYTLANAVINGLGISDATQKNIITYILAPGSVGNYYYAGNYNNSAQNANATFEADGYSVGQNVTADENVGYNGSATADARSTGVTASQTAVNNYLLTFSSLESVPKKIVTAVSAKYSYEVGKYATVTNVKDGGDCDPDTVTYTSYAWNYLTDVTLRAQQKNGTIKKALEKFVAYFDEEVLSLTFAEMLTLSAGDVKNILDVANLQLEAVKSTNVSNEVLDHFLKIESGYNEKLRAANQGFSYNDIVTYIDNLEKSYSIVLNKDSIDILVAKVGTDYTNMSYSQMASLYTSVKAAYEVVTAIDSYTLTYIYENYPEYGTKYDSVKASITETEAYMEALSLAMRNQHVIELDASMNDMVARYSAIAADTNNLDDITTTQLAAIDSKANGIIASLKNYSSEEKDKHITSEEQKAFNTLVANLEAKLEVRDDEALYDSKLDYFIPYLNKDFAGMSNDELVELHSESSAHYDELVSIYNQFVTDYGKDWADALFTYNFNGTDDLLQNHIYNNKASSDSALVDYMKSVNSAQLATVASYSGVSTVDFSNYAQIKSTLSHFDADFYTYCNDKRWTTSADQSTFAQVGCDAGDCGSCLLCKWKTFTKSNGESAFNKNFTYADANGDYVIRYAGDQTKTEVVDGEEQEVQIGYPNDIARDNEDKNGDGKADDNYTVSTDEINETIVKLDNLIISRDFGALVGLEDEDGNFTNLETYIGILFDELFTDELVNTLVAAVFPMLCELIESELAGALGGTTPTDSNASGAIYIDETFLGFINIAGTLNIYLDDDMRNGSIQQTQFPQLFSQLGLNIYPSTFADSLAKANPMLYGPSSKIYKDFTAAGRDWSVLLNEDGTMSYEWGVADIDTFRIALGAILKSIIPLLQAALGDYTLSEEVNSAAYIHGDMSVVGEVGAKGDLGITVKPIGLYNKLFIPLFETLRIDDNANFKMPSLKGEFSGDDLVDAIFEPLLELLDQIYAAPITKILDILPNLIYFLSMNTIGEILDETKITLILDIAGVDIQNDDSGTLAKIASAFESKIADAINLDNIELALGELINLDEMLGFNITDLNDVLNAVLSGGLIEMPEGMNISLPPLDQTGIMFSSTWVKTTSANGNERINLKANKADILFYLFNYLLTALEDPDFLTGILGDDLDPKLGLILNTVMTNLMNHPYDAVAAIMEILVPNTDANGDPEYELKTFEWATNTWNYGEIQGANQMSIVYLNYGNDWTREKADYLVDNIDTILTSVLTMVGSDVTDVNQFLKDKINGLFTNEVITDLVEALGGLGDSASAIVNDVISNQIGLNIEAWFNTFGYLYDADTWADDAVVVAPDNKNYENNIPDVTGVRNADGSITWSYKGQVFTDGDKDAFVDVFCAILDEFDIAIEFLLGGKDISAFEDVITLMGYESYSSTLGILLETLGVEGIATQAEFSTDGMAAFKKTLEALIDWLDTLLASDNMVEQVLELVPDLMYYIESNGLSTLLNNLLMPVLVLVDDVRPLIDLNINSVLSFILSDYINYEKIDIERLLSYISSAEPIADDDYSQLNIDIDNLRLSDIIKIADDILGTNLSASALTSIAVKGFTSGLVAKETIAGSGYTSTLTAADAITILLTGILEGLAAPAKDATKTNGDVLLAFIAEKTGKDIAGLYSIIQEVISGIEIVYESPVWGYMFSNTDVFSTTLPTNSIVYLGYNTDWTKESAKAVSDSLDTIVDLVLDSLLEGDDAGKTIAQLLNGILEDEVYTDANLNAIVEGVANLIGGLDESLRDLIDTVLDTDIASWFQMCNFNEETGKYECAKNWGVDAAAEADKKAVFIAGIKEALAPAEKLLSFLLFGESYEFLTGSEVDASGKYTYNDVITINGGEGYSYGLVPIFEALGCTMQPASNFYVAATETTEAYYDIDKAIDALLDSVFALVDDISGAPASSAMSLIANLIYFLNADGVKVSVNNLLAPIDGIVEKLSPVISENGEKVTLGGLLAKEIGLDISDLSTTTLLALAADEGIVLNSDMVNILKTFYIGNLKEFKSANGRTAYRIEFTTDDYKTQGDMVTVILSIALDLFKLNKTLFTGDGMLTTEQYDTVIRIITGAIGEFELKYVDPNWAYMYEGEDALAQLLANGLPARTQQNSIVYTQYTNHWNFATADYLASNLTTIVKGITDAARSDGSTVGTLLDDAITNGLYKDSILDSLLEAVVGLLAGLDKKLVDAVGATLGADINTWFDWCEITTDADGEIVVTCTKDWGIDSKATNAEKKTAFIEAFVTALAPANRLLAWLFFAEDYTFLNGTTSEELITIKGGEGYAEALVPLLEALGCEMKPVSAYYTTGTLDMSAAVRDVFTQLTNWLSAICGDIGGLENGNDSLNAMLDKLINVVYFLNAGGAKAVINNLLQPVNFILGQLSAFDVVLDIDTELGFPLTQLDFYAVFDIVADKVGLYFPDDVQNFVANVYLGEVESFPSANGETAYRMVYTETESRREMITILLSIVLESAQDPRNEGKLSDWLGADAYKAIMDLLNITEAKEMKEYTWLFTEDAGTDKIYSAIESSGRYEATYNENWTPEKAQYLADNFEPFIGNVLHLASPTIEGQKVTNLEQAVEALVSGNLYTQANADAIIDALAGVMADLMAMEPYGEYIENVALAMFGIDVHTWDNMTVTVTDGDRASFQAALTQILAPATPFLELLLVGKDVKLFYELNGEDTVVIPGSEGYAYGIIPLFEALGCDSLLTPAEYAAKIDEEPSNAVYYILDPLFDRIDAIQADPVNQIFEMLPAVIYFINCGGLDTSVKNIINTVDTVLEALEPVIGASSLLDLLDIEIEGEKLDLATINFDFIFDLLVDMLEEESGLEVRSFAADAVAELTTGKVVPYTSANGKTYYTMEYASPENKADMATVMLRLILDFATTDNNVEVFKALLADVITDEDSYNSICSVLDSLVQSAQEDPDMGNAIYAVYYVFVAAAEAAEGTDDLYHDVNNSWQFILKLLTDSNEPVLNDFAASLKDTLNEYFDGIFDDEGLASDGALTFFEKLKAFFQRIAEWFRKLFGMA